MAGLSRPKDGVLSHAYVPAIHVFADSSVREIRFANLFRGLRFFFNGAL
jgi:hypothetical protein